MQSGAPLPPAGWLDNSLRLAGSPAANAPVAALDRPRAMDTRRGNGARYAERIAVRTVNRIVIVPVEHVVRIEADDNYVRVHADRVYLHKETLTRLCARLDPAQFLRIHRSHAVSLRVLRELRPQAHGEFKFMLTDGTELRSGRSYRREIEAALGLA